jgi:hypothetical protein
LAARTGSIALPINFGGPHDDRSHDENDEDGSQTDVGLNQLALDGAVLVDRRLDISVAPLRRDGSWPRSLQRHLIRVVQAGTEAFDSLADIAH